MNFTTTEISLARQLHPLWGQRWQPSAGHYVYDADTQITKPSPFQDHVYFVLNYEYFMNLVGGLHSFRRTMIWLPTWEQSHRLAGEIDPASEDLFQRSDFLAALARQHEREYLYQHLLGLLQTKIDGSR